MYVDTFVHAAIAKINEKIEAAKESVASGAMGTIEDYRMVTGKISAYRDNIELLRELFAQFFETKSISRRDNNGEREPTY